MTCIDEYVVIFTDTPVSLREQINITCLFRFDSTHLFFAQGLNDGSHIWGLSKADHLWLTARPLKNQAIIVANELLACSMIGRNSGRVWSGSDHLWLTDRPWNRWNQTCCLADMNRKQFTLGHCMNFKAKRYESTSLNRIVGDKS